MKQLLLVVDYQKDFVDGALGFAGAETLDGPIAEKIAVYHAAGDDVAFTLDTHQENYLDTQEGQAAGAPLSDEYGGLAALRQNRTGHGQEPGYGGVQARLPLPVAGGLA